MEKQMRAERERREAILISEGHKQSAILEAEGKKAAVILEAEASKEARILEAEAAKEAAICKAEGEAQAILSVQKAVRIGTCGAVQEDINVRDLVIALGACTDSSLMNQRFGDLHFAPTPDWGLLRKAVEVAEAKGFNPHVGTIVSSDLFYDENENWKLWAKYGALAIEMEAAELFTLAKKYNRKALAVLTVSDHIVKHQETSAEERQTSFSQMVEVALDTVTSM